MPDPKAHPLTKCRNFNELREPRLGVMLHYDGSTHDGSAVRWFTNPECQVSYNYLVLDDGSYVPIVPEGKRAWHAGACLSSDPERLRYRDANSAFVGIAIATDGSTPATGAQLATVAWLARREFERQGWKVTDGWRIVGHDDESIFPNTPETPVRLRGKRGRKIDPTGPRAGRPILSTAEIRARVAAGPGVVAPPNALPSAPARTRART
jgi:N-acetyl-anhydromuramyl-L-alanine amidase AmpD